MNPARFIASATLDGEALDDEDIRDEELARARHALAYLKELIGNAAMRDLLARDLETTTKRVRAWVEASAGQWQNRRHRADRARAGGS